jgi:EAL domain-containing protein (putative c-di-GMP-specific phosphodiesterase class I)/ActR/RegA family two-component response regulator
VKSPQRKGRVLIIDDDHLVGAMLVAHARASGFDARVTDDPNLFYSWAREWKPTFVVVDLVMGEVDGLTVLKALAEMHSDAAVVIASGMGAKILDSARQFASASGLAYGGVLHKPFRRADVAAVLAAGSHAPDTEGAVLDVFGDWDSEHFEEALLRAVARDELGVAFQPKVACDTGRLVGYEALVRWTHPILGAIPPDAFIPRAESLHLVSLVTDSVAATSMAWFASARAHTSERLAINISAVELTGPDLGTRLLAECKRSGVDPSRIILEVTETSAMANPTESLEVLTRLRLDGFQLSIDDFGTGYSSMVQLSTMPFTEVKIDRSFVRHLGTSLPAEVMVRSMLQLSRGLGVECVAEGVETAAALDVLSEMGCDFAQGYHIGYPMTESDLEAWILAHGGGR